MAARRSTPLVLLTDDRLVESMRAFVTASNRRATLSARGGVDVQLLEQVTEDQRVPGLALQQTLVEPGWRGPAC